ncbi:hypothetical protein QUF64_05370 [Anaerolineales bacterium HSG6]|nr:hypothetical protein [Anaerolineales bacterium HSG6]
MKQSELNLESLENGIPVIPTGAAQFYKQNCMVCLYQHGHKSGVNLTVEYQDTELVFTVSWLDEVDETLLRAYADLIRATDHAACGLALLLIRELTDYTAIEQACIGTTIDYYLVPKKTDGDLIFNDTARLEVSGILQENRANTVQARINQKQKRLKPSLGLPTFIVVIEFSKPWSKVVKQ